MSHGLRGQRTFSRPGLLRRRLHVARPSGQRRPRLAAQCAQKAPRAAVGPPPRAPKGGLTGKPPASTLDGRGVPLGQPLTANRNRRARAGVLSLATQLWHPRRQLGSCRGPSAHTKPNWQQNIPPGTATVRDHRKDRNTHMRARTHARKQTHTHMHTRALRNNSDFRFGLFIGTFIHVTDRSLCGHGAG
jgi:hypothetical protein